MCRCLIAHWKRKSALCLFCYVCILLLVLITDAFAPPASSTSVGFLSFSTSLQGAAAVAQESSAAGMVLEKTRDDFRGKNVLLTGASGGLGRALALQLAHCQVGTLCLSARNESELKKVADECQRISSQPNGTTIHIVPCDLADPSSVDALAKQALDKCGGNKIDVLVNNGGVSSRSRFVDTTNEVDRRVMQINFLSGAALAKAVVPGMMKSSSDDEENKKKKPGTAGRIIWISSVQGLVGIPNRSSYAASKFAVQGYCESLRAELASSGISVHCVSPGYIRTNLSKSALSGDGTKHGVMDETTAAGADPDQVAAAILDRVAAGQNDFTIAAGLSAVAAIWMRLLCPRLLQNLLVKRYEKSLQKEKED